MKLKRLLAMIMVCVMTLSVLTATSSAVPNGTGYYRVTALTLIVDSGLSGGSSSSIEILRNGELVNIISVNGNMGQISKNRWINLNYAGRTSPLQSISGIKIIAADTYLFNGAGIKYSSIGKLPQDTKVYAESSWVYHIDGYYWQLVHVPSLSLWGFVQSQYLS
jgi:hypothetical protein